MILILFNKQEYVIGQEQANKIEQAMVDGTKFFKVHGDLIATSSVMLIKSGGVQVNLDESRQIDAPDYRGIDSPAKDKLRQQVKKLAESKCL